METARKIVRAKLIAIRWDENHTPHIIESGDRARTVEVQFNPATLKVTYTNQIETGGEATASSMQYVGKGTSKLSLELIFDASAPRNKNVDDVRLLTEEVTAFMKTEKEGSGDEVRYTVSGVRFEWGTFKFDGVIESLDETLDLFSEEGHPLRATMSVNMSYQGITLAERDRNNQATDAPGSGSATGTKPLTPAKQGDTLQGMVASAGINADWKAVAAANGIENPRFVNTGSLLDLKAGVKASANLSASISMNTNLSGNN